MITILLVEDNPGDIRLTKEAFKECKLKNKLYIVNDGLNALKFLKNEDEYIDKPTPDLILLDLNLPKMNGQEILKTIKTNNILRHIPVVVLTTSKAEEDIVKSYDLQANCFISKPVDFEKFVYILQKIQEFWLTIVKLP